MISAAHHGMMAMASADDMSFVEYLESSGTQYIDTGIKQAADIEIQAEYMPVGTVVQWGTYFGCGYQDKSAYNILGRHHSTTSNKFNPWFANSDYTQCQITVNTSSKIRVTLKSGSCTAGGTTGTITSVTSGLVTGYNMYLFSANKDNAPWRSQPCRIYSFKVLKAGEVVMDLVPVKKNGVGYMLDRVTWKLFGNDGTGSFKTGSKIYDAEVEYVESTGTQYVDTGVAVSDPSTIAIEADEDVTQPLGFTHQNVTAGTWVSRYSPSSATENLYIYYKNYSNRVVTSANETRKAARWDGSSGYYENGASLASFVASVGSDSIAGRNWLYGAVWDFNNNAVDFRSSRAGRIYGLKVKVSGILVRDFIPVRVGAAGYLYDRVSGQLFGQGDLLVGSDMPTVKCAVFDGTVNSRIKSAAIASDPVQQQVPLPLSSRL